MPKKEERSFVYQKRDKSTLKERANMKGGNFDSIIKPSFKQWKPKEGKNRIRILPPTWKNAKHYGLDIYVNYGIGADSQSYLSLSRHGKGADPLADARREAQKEGEKELAKKLQPSTRILYWIIDRLDEDEGPLLWAAPFTFDKSLSNLCIDEDTKDVIFIDGPKDGHDVRFYREGTMLNTTYDPSRMKVLPESPISEDADLQHEWLSFINENPLPDVLNFYSFDHILAQFEGASKPDDDDEDEDEKPVRGKARAKADDDDDEDTPPSKTRGPRRDPDDDEIEKPAKRTRAVRDDDDEDEKPSRTRQRAKPSDDDDDEDEDEKPVRGKASRRSSRDDDDDDAEEDEKPARTVKGKTKPAPDDDDDEDEDPPSTRRTKKSDDEDEEGGGSLRQRLAARRRSSNSDDD